MFKPKLAHTLCANNLWLHLENSNGTSRLRSVSLLKNVHKRSTIAQIHENIMILSSAWVEWQYIILSWSFVRVDVLILLFLYTSLNNSSFSIQIKELNLKVFKVGSWNPKTNGSLVESVRQTNFCLEVWNMNNLCKDYWDTDFKINSQSFVWPSTIGHVFYFHSRNLLPFSCSFTALSFFIRSR